LILALCTDLLQIYYLVSAVLATQGTSVWNFNFTERWVFKVRRPRSTLFRRFGLYLAMNNLALVMRVPLMFVLTSILGAHYVVSNILSILLLTVVRYLCSEKLIWRELSLVPKTKRQTPKTLETQEIIGLCIP
jgi:dolichol-phosphate mannosyltransferase